MSNQDQNKPSKSTQSPPKVINPADMKAVKDTKDKKNTNSTGDDKKGGCCG